MWAIFFKSSSHSRNMLWNSREHRVESWSLNDLPPHFGDEWREIRLIPIYMPIMLHIIYMPIMLHSLLWIQK